VQDAIAFTFGASKDAKGLAPLIRIAGDTSRPPLIRANALGYLRSFADPMARKALLDAARDPHPAVRLAALLSLTDQGRVPDVRVSLESGLLDARRTVRMASALGLINAGSGQSKDARLGPAMNLAFDEHARRARFLNEDAATQLDLGKMYFLAGDGKAAEASVKDALRLDPTIAGGRYFLGLATLRQGRIAEGAALLRSVDRSDPHRKDALTILAKLPAS
jgi:tetratricopeptide (TPR) repeat protein